jgi:hypothetical protein
LLWRYILIIDVKSEGSLARSPLAARRRGQSPEVATLGLLLNDEKRELLSGNHIHSSARTTTNEYLVGNHSFTRVHMGSAHDRDQQGWIPVVVLCVHRLLLDYRLPHGRAAIRLGYPRQAETRHGTTGRLGRKDEITPITSRPSRLGHNGPHDFRIRLDMKKLAEQSYPDGRLIAAADAVRYRVFLIIFIFRYYRDSDHPIFPHFHWQ